MRLGFLAQDVVRDFFKKALKDVKSFQVRHKQLLKLPRLQSKLGNPTYGLLCFGVLFRVPLHV